MTGAPSATPSDRRARLEAAAEVVARARHELAAGGAPDMSTLLNQLDAIDRELALLPAASVQELRPLLLTLLDEVGLLTAATATRKSELTARSSPLRPHWQARTAYRRINRP